MTNDERLLYEIVAKLEAAWNRYDSVAWTALFADDADFIHVLGRHFHGRDAIEHGRTAFQNTLVTTDAVPTLSDTLAQAHPIKGDTPVK